MLFPWKIHEENKDLLTSLLRSGARELITKAVHIELTEFLAGVTDDLLDLKDRGFRSPGLAIGDEALGFWKASRNVCGVSGLIRAASFAKIWKQSVQLMNWLNDERLCALGV